MALTVWTVAVVALVVAGVIEAERESDYWFSSDRAAMAVVYFGLLVWSAGFLLFSLVAWRINRIRLRHPVEKDRGRDFTSSL